MPLEEKGFTANPRQWSGTGHGLENQGQGELKFSLWPTGALPLWKGERWL